jgi:hypothetical protein
MTRTYLSMYLVFLKQSIVFCSSMPLEDTTTMFLTKPVFSFVRITIGIAGSAISMPTTIRPVGKVAGLYVVLMVHQDISGMPNECVCDEKGVVSDCKMHNQTRERPTSPYHKRQSKRSLVRTRRRQVEGFRHCFMIQETAKTANYDAAPLRQSNA